MYKRTRKGRKAYLSSSERCLTLHIIRHRPKMKDVIAGPKYNTDIWINRYISNIFEKVDFQIIL